MTEEKRKNVGVLCNIPNGIELRLFGAGHDDGTGKSPLVPYDSFTLRGPSALNSGVGSTDASQLGLGSTPVNEVDEQFMKLWFEQNKGSPFVRQGAIAMFDLPDSEDTAAGGSADEPLPLGAGGPEGAGATGEGGTDSGTLAPGTGTHEGGAAPALAGQGTEGRAATGAAPEAGVVKRDLNEGTGASEAGSSSFMAGAASPPGEAPIGSEPLTGGAQSLTGAGGGNQAGELEKASEGDGASADGVSDDGKGIPTYDPELKAFPDGYPKGAIIRSEIIPGVFYRCTEDGNKVDPDEGTGAGWEHITEAEAEASEKPADGAGTSGKS